MDHHKHNHLNKKLFSDIQHFAILQPFFNPHHSTHHNINPNTYGILAYYQISQQQYHYPPQVLPDGCIDILFECHHKQPCVRVFGSTLHIQHVPIHQHIRYFGVRLLPGFIPTFLQPVAAKLINQSLDLNSFIHPHLLQQISCEQQLEKQIERFTQLFQQQFSFNFSFITEYLLTTIMKQNGLIKIQQLEKQTGYCCRHIQRLFKQDVGMSIKSFANIIRFQTAIRHLSTLQQHKLADLSYRLGFNDQPHFYKTFQKYCAMSPTDFMQQLQIYNVGDSGRKNTLPNA